MVDITGKGHKPKLLVVVQTGLFLCIRANEEIIAKRANLALLVAIGIGIGIGNRGQALIND
jgi:hypothetical protein